MFGIFGKTTKLMLRPRNGDTHLLFMSAGVGVFSGFVIFAPGFREYQYHKVLRMRLFR